MPPVRRPREPEAPRIVPTDGELLGLFRQQGDRDALDRVIERHAPMVWSVCRGQLRRAEDAEDAFQATFLVLVRHAASIRSSDSAAGWLYRVAYRTAIRARKQIARRREEALALDPDAPGEEAFPDLLKKQTTGVLIEELMRLPAKYQTPLVLRYLEGQSRRAIADQTDSTIATVQGRLARGKVMLRRRLLRRGVSLSAAMAALGVGVNRAGAEAPAHLIAQTASNGVALATGGSLAASTAVTLLFRQGVNAMFFASLSKPVAAGAAVALVAALFLVPGGGGPLPIAHAGTPAIDATLPEEETFDEALTLHLAHAAPPASPRRGSRQEPAGQPDAQATPSADAEGSSTGQEVTIATITPSKRVPPVDDAKRLTRLLALRERIEEVRERFVELGVPGNTVAGPKLDRLWKATDQAIETLAERQVAQLTEVLEQELAVLLPGGKDARESESDSPLLAATPGSPTRTLSAGKMKVRVGEPAVLETEDPSDGRKVRLRYTPADDGETATITLEASQITLRGDSSVTSVMAPTAAVTPDGITQAPIATPNGEVRATAEPDTPESELKQEIEQLLQHAEAQTAEAERLAGMAEAAWRAAGPPSYERLRDHGVPERGGSRWNLSQVVSQPAEVIRVGTIKRKSLVSQLTKRVSLLVGQWADQALLETTDEGTPQESVDAISVYVESVTRRLAELEQRSRQASSEAQTPANLRPAYLDGLLADWGLSRETLEEGLRKKRLSRGYLESMGLLPLPDEATPTDASVPLVGGEDALRSESRRVPSTGRVIPGGGDGSDPATR